MTHPTRWCAGTSVEDSAPQAAGITPDSAMGAEASASPRVVPGTEVGGRPGAMLDGAVADSVRGAEASASPRVVPGLEVGGRPGATLDGAVDGTPDSARGAEASASPRVVPGMEVGGRPGATLDGAVADSVRGAEASASPRVVPGMEVGGRLGAMLDGAVADSVRGAEASASPRVVPGTEVGGRPGATLDGAVADSARGAEASGPARVAPGRERGGRPRGTLDATKVTPPRPEPPRLRLLVLRALGLGDLLAGVPALRALRRAHPGHEIVLAAPVELEPVAAATGAVDRLLPASAPGRAVPAALDWSGPPPDIAVDLHGNGPPSHRLLTRLNPLKLLAFAHPEMPEIDGPPWYAEEHERDRWCRLLQAYGIDADPGDVRLPRPHTASPAPGAVVLHPGAGSPSRRWPVERYATVATGLRARGLRVVVTGGADEGDLVARLAKRAGLPDTDVFGGGLPFGRLAALVADAHCVISGDTGIAHLAVAHATRSVTLFGPVAPSRWGPPDTPRHRALWYGPEGDPHGRHTDPALLRITTQDVLRAVDELPGTPHR